MDELTADLAAVIEQARANLGAPRPRVAGGGNRVLAGVRLLVPGWPLGLWAADGAAVDVDSDGAQDDLRMVWLAETGHLLWLAADRDDPDLTVIVADTPRSFHGCVCERPAVGDAVWEAIVDRLPLLAACPLGFDAWSAATPRTSHPGGPALLADDVTRALDDELAALVRKDSDPRQGRAEQTSFSWATEDDRFHIPGVFAATATERPYPPGTIIQPDDIKHFLFLSALGTWLSYTSHADQTSTIREFDTIRDLYRFQIAGRVDDDVFRQMWNNLVARHPLARDAELNPLARWAPRP
jgi:hypothetical protein